MENEFLSHSPDETMALGKRFAASLKAGDVVCLKGDLGAGKTHFVKGIVQIFGIEEGHVHSPTFTLINEYHGDLSIYHFDCYRMKAVEEALEIGAEEYFYGHGICLIEWPEKIENIIPQDAIWISIDEPEPSSRKFVIGKNRS